MVQFIESSNDYKLLILNLSRSIIKINQRLHHCHCNEESNQFPTLQVVQSRSESLFTSSLSETCRRNLWILRLTCTSDSSGRTADLLSTDQTSGSISLWLEQNTLDSSGFLTRFLSTRRSQPFTRQQQRISSSGSRKVSWPGPVLGKWRSPGGQSPDFLWIFNLLLGKECMDY